MLIPFIYTIAGIFEKSIYFTAELIDTILSKSTHGEFSENADFEYIDLLHKFVNIVHNEYIGGGYALNDLVIGDAQYLLQTVQAE
ncbi:MAG: hypothetical protein KOO69_02920 [Victivallales bacterium]|nr:hypothetical protein [Victivallales bacterium]